MSKPSYLALYESGELEARAHLLAQMLTSCTLCPRQCRVNRLNGELGYCRAGANLMISSYFPHFGEERPLVGKGGSGTIFLTHCNLRCSFCQNYELSHGGEGEIVSVQRCGQMMMTLQYQGCHNINWVTPTHYAPQLVAALIHAIRLGLQLPIVYNCGGYESLEVIRLLDGIVDIYMPDAKFSSEDHAKQFANAPDYFERLKPVLKEMHRQVGDLQIQNGIAYRGLLIRHLVMPNDIAGSDRIFKFIAEEISKDNYVNIMAQYRPCYLAFDTPGINRRITMEEYNNAIQLAKKYGLHRGFSLTD